MGFTVANITTLTKQCLSILNASSAYAATSDDDKFVTAEITEALLEGDERIWLAIAESRNHWARPDIMTESADITANGAEVPTHTGELGLVTIKAVSSDSTYQIADPLGNQEIDVYRRNNDSTFNAGHNANGTLTGGYYDKEALEDGVAYFTGYALRVRVAAYTRTAACQSPENYSLAILYYAWSVLFSKDGLDPELAKYYATLAEKAEQRVRGGAMDLSEMREAA